MPNHTTEPFTFFFAFFLPSGKDIFGIKGWKDVKMNIPTQADLKDPNEFPITHHYTKTVREMAANRAKELEALKKGATHSNAMFGSPDFMESTQHIWVGNSDLPLRMLRQEFTFTLKNQDLISDQDKVDVQFTTYSNGLYIWRFDLELTDGSEKPNEKKIRSFLRENFMQNHILELFTKRKTRTEGWTKHYARGGNTARNEEDSLKDYDGVISYPQMDLLYNGLFNMELLPKLFFTGMEGDGELNKVIEIARIAFSMKSLLENISLFIFPEEGDDPNKKFAFKPLYYSYRAETSYPEKSKYEPNLEASDYSVRSSIEDTILVSDIGKREGLKERRDRTATKGKEIKAINYLYSRAFFSALEHFTRILSLYGVSIYREGISFSRKALIKEHFVLRLNKGAGQLFSGSELKIATDIHLLEAYHNLLKSKLPPLRVFCDLVNDLKSTGWPPEMHEAHRNLHSGGEPQGFKEWEFALCSLDAAINQLTRNINSIEYNLESIQFLLSTEQQERIHLELVRNRRINELEPEGRLYDHNIQLEESYKKQQLLLTQFSLIAAVIFGAGQIIPWLADKEIDGDMDEVFNLIFSISITSFLFWTVVLWFFYRMCMMLLRKLKKKRAESSYSNVYDYSYLRIYIPETTEETEPDVYRTISHNIISGITRAWQRELISINNDKYKVRTSRADELEEAPTPGVMRFKYSYESENELYHPKFIQRIMHHIPLSSSFFKKPYISHALQFETEYHKQARALFLTSFRVVIRYSDTITPKHMNTLNRQALALRKAYLNKLLRGMEHEDRKGILKENFSLLEEDDKILALPIQETDTQTQQA